MPLASAEYCPKLEAARAAHELVRCPSGHSNSTEVRKLALQAPAPTSHNQPDRARAAQCKARQPSRRDLDRQRSLSSPRMGGLQIPVPARQNQEGEATIDSNRHRESP